MTYTIGLFLYGAAFVNGVTLKHDSYSAESALAQLDETAQLVTPCLCFRYKDGAIGATGSTEPADAIFWSKIELGGYITTPDSNN